MVAEASLRTEVVKDPALGGMTSNVGLKFCWKFTDNALGYQDYIDTCNINGDCYRMWSEHYSPKMVQVNKYLANKLCDLSDIDDRIEELHMLAKKYKDPETTEDIAIRLKNLGTFREQYLQVFAEEIKEKKLQLKDRKHLPGKDYKHAKVSGVKKETEEVAA